MFLYIKYLFLFAGLLAFSQTVLAQFDGTTNANADGGSLQQALLTQYRSLRPQLNSNQFGEPVYIESSSEGGVSRGQIYAVISSPFAQILSGLSRNEHWCDIVMLHINVKACVIESLQTHSQQSDKTQSKYSEAVSMAVYVGRKYYQSPEDAFAMNYQFLSTHRSNNLMTVTLSANEGPLGTSNYQLEFEAIPLDNTTSFIHFSYAYDYGFMAKIALQSYLATIGKNKLGFSIIDYDEHQNPIYVKGMQGMLERNVMRYFLAIRAFLETLSEPQDTQRERRIVRWFELTNHYHKQLFEMDRTNYIAMKKREMANHVIYAKISNRP